MHNRQWKVRYERDEGKEALQIITQTNVSRLRYGTYKSACTLHNHENALQERGGGLQQPSNCRRIIKQGTLRRKYILYLDCLLYFFLTFFKFQIHYQDKVPYHLLCHTGTGTGLSSTRYIYVFFYILQVSNTLPIKTRHLKGTVQRDGSGRN